MKPLKIIVSLLLLLPALALLAFGPRSERVAPKDVVVVEYWEKWTGEEAVAIRQIADDFNRTVGKEKGIYVNCLSTSGVVQKTLISTAAGVPPDVAGLWDTIVAQFAALDALEPLDELAAAHGITPDTYKKVFWDECSYDGKLYALVTTPYDFALHYNTRIFAESADRLRAAGLDPSRPPRTIAELDAYAAALDRVGPDGTIQLTGFLPLEPGWDLGFISSWFGGSWWDEKNKKFTFTDPKVVQAYTWVQSYSKRLGKAAVSDFRGGFGNFDSPQNPFMAGTVAMENQGTFMANFIRNQNPKMAGQWAAAPFPSAVPGVNDITYCTADVMVIPKGAKNKKEAFEFIAYVNSQPVMEKLCSLHCKISPLAKVSDEFIRNHGNPYVKVFDDLAASPRAYGTPSVPIFPQVSEEISNFVQNLAQMRVTPEQGLAEMQVRLQGKYDAFMEKQRLRRVAEDQGQGRQ